MNNKEQLVIVGGGPCGLTLATLLSKEFNVVLIDANKKLGGCHRVERLSKSTYTEHGPRVYSSSYINFKKVIKKYLKKEFDDYFTKYLFDITSIGNYGFSQFTLREKSILTYNYLRYIINESHFKTITVDQFVKQNKFSSSSRDYLDRLCRLTDGADITRYTVDKFFSLINDNAFYRLYQPKTETDIGLFKDWEHFLKKRCTIIKDRIITDIYPDKNEIRLNDKRSIKYSKVIFAIPPKQLEQVNGAKECFGTLTTDYIKKTNYNKYYSVTFFWKKKYDEFLKNKHGFPINEWGIVFIVSSDYSKTLKKKYPLVISTAITYTLVKSSVLNKTASECNSSELKTEILRQLNESLPKPDKSYLHVGTVKDTAFINTSGVQYTPVLSEKYNNIYTCGTHNGNSYYNFTSLESAVTNGIALSNELSKTDKLKIDRIVKLNDIVKILLTSMALIYISS